MQFWKKILAASAKDQRYGGELSFRDSFKALRYIPPFLAMVWRTEPRLASINICLRLLSAGIPVTTLYIGKLIIDEVVRLSQTPDPDMASLWTWIGAELGLVLLSALMDRLISLSESLLGDLFANKSSVQLIEHAAALDLPALEDPTFHDKLDRARQNTTSRTWLLSQVLLQAQDLITALFLAVGLVAFNPWLILLLVVTVIPAFISELHFNQHSYSLTRSWTPERRELDYIRYVGGSTVNAKEVKLFGLAQYLGGQFAQLSQRYYLANRKLAVQRAAWGFALSILGTAGYYVAYGVIAMQAVAAVITLGDLTFLAGSFARLRGAVQGMLLRFSGIAQSALYLRDFFEFFEQQPQIASPAHPRPFPQPIREGFVFENVSFSYPDASTPVLQGLSFTLRAGEKLALVGENGAGKTTLVKLLTRLYDPTAGRILLDGYDLREYDLQDLRQAIGVIFQDFVRYDFTLGENIAVGQISERENQSLIEHAAARSLADTVVQKMENGYQQKLGRKFDGGTELSGGQWQKVALGRAYMREAQLMILDEPTSALDARAEYEVFERFSALTRDKMAVLISHRFSTVRMADRILVLVNGAVAETGTHDELLAANGLYAELFALQAQGYK
ncbi:MAG: ABC transporter ATP-binding protein [Bacteroidia bacterium]|nr:ABC transporter ATP-binding protein [Bacteroidia bacterium]